LNYTAEGRRDFPLPSESAISRIPLDFFEIGQLHILEYASAIHIQCQQNSRNKECQAFEKYQAEDEQHHGNDLKPQHGGGALIDHHTEGKEITAQGQAHYDASNNGYTPMRTFDFLQGFKVVVANHSQTLPLAALF
jgi:hypothetical protein